MVYMGVGRRKVKGRKKLRMKNRKENSQEKEEKRQNGKPQWRKESGRGWKPGDVTSIRGC